jgi:hypothetical protein
MTPKFNASCDPKKEIKTQLHTAINKQAQADRILQYEGNLGTASLSAVILHQRVICHNVGISARPI